MPSVQQPLQRGGSTTLSRASLKDELRLTLCRPAAAAAFNSDTLAARSKCWARYDNRFNGAIQQIGGASHSVETNKKTEVRFVCKYDIKIYCLLHAFKKEISTKNKKISRSIEITK